MLINKYNITLSRLTRNDIELVREKRNSADIREQMIYQKHIDSTAQQRWFNSIDNMYNLYMLIEVNHQKIGLINGKNSDFINKQSEGGIFIWDKSYHDSIIPAIASVIMLDYNFLICEFEKSYIKILNTNKKAINFNKQIGYKLLNINNQLNYSIYSINKDVYLNRIKPLRKYISKLTNDYTELGMHNFSFQNTTDKDMIRLYGKVPDYLKKKINLVLKNENRKLLE